MAAGWKLGQDAPLNVGTALLLTDGTVFAQDDSSAQAWWRLWPDTGGNYDTATWTEATPALHRRPCFLSAVLADGRVFVAGGGGEAGAYSHTKPSAEIYDPQNDTWTDLPTPPGWRVLSNAPCCVLNDGTVLVGNPDSGACALFDPVQGDWRPTGQKTNASARGESWTLLPDGSVLSINGARHPQTERYKDGTWASAASIPAAADLVDAASLDMGPAILMTDGSVLGVGATGQTAIYQPVVAAAGNWRAGPALSQAPAPVMAARDAPACLLPSGKVLFLASEVTAGGGSFGSSSIAFEYDPVGQKVARAAQQPPNVASVPPRLCRLLLLPNGQVMLTNGTPRLAFLIADGPLDKAWWPAAINPPQKVSPRLSYVLRGTQLNGLSQGCAGGDDAAMATNYPLVRLTATGAPKTVTYCRTFDHSTMGVATGTAEQSTSFVVPGGMKAGAYVLEVVANGIASEPYDVTVLVRGAGEESNEISTATTRNLKDDQRLQEEMLWRDLNEVHLLMDFISGTSDKLLVDVGPVPMATSGASTMEAAPAPAPNATTFMPIFMSAQDALQRVCNIRFPPVGTPEEKGRQALLLLQVKDRLNRIASPARGMTVAFTSMAAGTAGSSKDLAAGASGERRAPAPAWIVDVFGQMRRGEPTAAERRQVTGFAIASYPNLEGQARWFRLWFAVLPHVALIWLLATGLTYWDVALSSQALHSAVLGITVTDKDCIPPPPAAGSKAEAAPAPPAKLKIACDALAIAEREAMGPGEILARDEREALFIGHWRWHPVGWIVHAFGPGAPPLSDAASGAAVKLPPDAAPVDPASRAPVAAPAPIAAPAASAPAAPASVALTPAVPRPAPAGRTPAAGAGVSPRGTPTAPQKRAGGALPAPSGTNGAADKQAGIAPAAGHLSAHDQDKASTAASVKKPELSATADPWGPCRQAGACDYGADVTNFAIVVIAVFTDYILPMMFGILGTLAGLIRSFSAKIRESTLSPRDLQLMFSLIPLGAVAGLAVGLVVSPAQSVSLTAGMPLTLSAAGLAFLAGYGADAFFGMIDGLLTRVFSLTPPPPASGSK